jgi:hypothetical protein
MIIPGKRRLSAESFRALGIALFGEDWEAIMAHELNVDRSIVGSWATQGPPADRADALRHIAGYRRERIRVVMGSPGMPEHNLSALQRANAMLAEYELLSEAPDMVYSRDGDNEEIVIRIIADLLHSCARDRVVDVIRAAQSLHEAERTPA